VTIVVDTNVVVSAAFWPKSEDRRCFVLLARRKCRMAVTEVILREYRSLVARIGLRECPDRDPTLFLDWIERVALLVEPAANGAVEMPGTIRFSPVPWPAAPSLS
jgi:predicted nucleic acid-binding protein